MRFPIGRFAHEQNELYGEPCPYCGEEHAPNGDRYPMEGCPDE